MYKRYNACCPPQRRGPQTAACCIPRASSALPGSNPGAVPESTRIAQSGCGEAWVTTNVPLTCADTDSASATMRVQKIRVPTTPGTALPTVVVASTPASLTTQYKAAQVATTASDPYDPATRFAQYFPPQPPGAPCNPERIPNPAPPERPCVPITRFHGSAWPPAT